MGFSAGAAFSFEAFDCVFDGVAGSGGATETSAGGAEREVPQPIAPRFALMIIGGRQHGALCLASPLGLPARRAPLRSIVPRIHNLRRHFIQKGRASNIRVACTRVSRRDVRDSRCVRACTCLDANEPNML